MKKSADLVSVYKTALFKLHNPSQHRRAMLIDSMKRAHRGYSKILAAVEPDVRALIGIPKKDRKPKMAEITRKAAELARPLPLGNGPKQAIQLEVIAQAESFLELIAADDKAAYPTPGKLTPDKSEYAKTLKSIAASTIEGSERQLASELAKADRSPMIRPLGIYKNRINDGFLLLKDEKGRLFAWINLHSASSRFAKPVDIRDMIDTRTGEVMSFRSSTGALFPLEMAEDFHVARFLREGRAQSARLIHRHGEFYLAVAFLYQAVARQPDAYIGIDRGIENLAAWAVIDGNGKRVASGRIDGTKLREMQKRAEQKKADEQRRGLMPTGGWRTINDIAVHTAANEIVSLAIRYNAKVVMEDLSAISNGHHHRRPKGRARVGFSKLLSRAQYQKLEQVLTYKLAVEGYPEPGKQHPAYTSTTCPDCGHCAKENRASQAEFKCVKCGREAHADENAGEVIGLKGMWWDAVKPAIKKGVKMTDDQKFAGWLRNRLAA